MSVYNGETYLGEAIESILHQEFTDFELVIIDDGSTDASAEIIESYDDPRIRFFENEHNIGLIGSLNRGLGLAWSPYVARMDADDVSLPERLARQVDFLDAHPEIGVLGCAVEVIDGSGNPSHTRRFAAEHRVLRWRLCFGNPIMHPTVIMRREVVNRVGGYSSDMLHAEDYDLWRRLSSVTRLANLQDVLLCLRTHEDSVTSKHLVQQRNNSIKISQLAIAGILSEDVPLDVVQRLWAQDFESASELLQVARLIHRLCQATIAASALSPAERRIIRSDAANRLFRLASPRIRGPRAWEVVGLACRVDPSLVVRVATRIFHRMIRGRAPSCAP